MTGVLNLNINMSIPNQTGLGLQTGICVIVQRLQTKV